MPNHDPTADTATMLALALGFPTPPSAPIDESNPMLKWVGFEGASLSPYDKCMIVCTNTRLAEKSGSSDSTRPHL
jgi:hypothetical protein